MAKNCTCLRCIKYKQNVVKQLNYVLLVFYNSMQHKGVVSLESVRCNYSLCANTCSSLNQIRSRPRWCVVGDCLYEAIQRYFCLGWNCRTDPSL